MPMLLIDGFIFEDFFISFTPVNHTKMNKNKLYLAQIGALLPLCGFILSGWLLIALNLTSTLLLLLAHAYFAKFFKRKSIFTLYLFNYIILYTSFAVGVYGIIGVFQETIIPEILKLDEDLAATFAKDVQLFLQKLQLRMNNEPDFAQQIAALIMTHTGKMTGYAFLIITGFAISLILARTALVQLGNASRISEFKTAGLLYLIAVFSFIFLIGFIVLFVGYIFLIVGYFNLKQVTPAEDLEEMY